MPDTAFDLAAFLRDGPAVVVATSDAELHPEIARAWGPRLVDDGATLALCVAAAPGSRTRANLERGGVIAVTVSVPTTYRTVQLKGAITAMGEPTPDDLARVEEHLAAFGAQVVQVGIAASHVARFREPVLLAVRMAIAERYEQTPGPRAGAAL